MSGPPVKRSVDDQLMITIDLIIIYFYLAFIPCHAKLAIATSYIITIVLPSNITTYKLIL